MFILPNNCHPHAPNTSMRCHTLNPENLYTKAYVKDLFNRISNTYDKVNNISSFGISTLIRKSIIKSNFGKSGKQIEVLDVMSGNGETWNTIKEVFPNGNLTALDFSDEMHLKSIKLNKTHFNNKIMVLNEDILQNSLQSNCYDVVISAFGIKHLNTSQTEVLSKEVNRILKKNGQFIFLEVSVPDNRIVRVLFSIYLKSILPAVAFFFSDHLKDYQLLWMYLKSFKNCRQAQLIFNSNGLTTNYQSHAFGMLTSIKGYKK